MRTIPKLILAAFLACLQWLTAAAVAQPPCVDCPTPPPCTAEGACYPKRGTHGYYRQQWRRWPTDVDGSRRPTDAAPGVNRYVLPPKETEDQAAPPPSEPREEQPTATEPGEGVREIDLPALPPLPGQPMPGVPAAPGGNNGDDPPPGLPPLPGFNAPPGISPPPRPAGGPGQTRSQKSGSQDAPPALPAGFAGLLGGSDASQAVYRSSGPQPNWPSTQAVEPVSPAYYSTPVR